MITIEFTNEEVFRLLRLCEWPADIKIIRKLNAQIVEKSKFRKLIKNTNYGDVE